MKLTVSTYVVRLQILPSPRVPLPASLLLLRVLKIEIYGRIIVSSAGSAGI